MIKVKNTIFAIVLLLFFADCHTPITSTPEPAKPKITLITKTDLEIDVSHSLNLVAFERKIIMTTVIQSGFMTP